MKDNTLIVVVFPTLSIYPIAPEDQSFSTAEDCQYCKNKCWVSEKKKKLIVDLMQQKKSLYTGCYTCFKKHIKENKEKNKKIKWAKVNI